MVAFKLKFMHVEDEKLYLFPIIHNYNAYNRVHNNFGVSYGTVLPCYSYLYGTGILDKAVFRNQKYSYKHRFISYISSHWCYIIYSGKTDTTKNITIRKTT